MENTSAINKKCGDRLKKWREKKRMTQNELAEKSNYSITQISYIENGKRGMSASAAKIFSEILEVRENFLLCIDDFATKEDYIFYLKNFNSGNDSLIQIICDYGYFIDEIMSNNILEHYEDEGGIDIIDTDKWFITENGSTDGECWSCPDWRMQEYFEDIRAYMIFKLKQLISKCEKASEEEKNDIKEYYKEYFENLKS